MSDENIGFLVSLIMAAIFGVGIGGHFVTASWENDLINRGLAIHCPKTGDFAFKGECE